MAMMVLSRKITSSFQKFNGISLLINAGAELFVKNIGICRILRFPLFLSLHRQTVPLCIL